MENELVIKCGNCGHTTITTNKALKFRCSWCSKEIFVQSGIRNHPPPDRDYNGSLLWSGNRNKCIKFKNGRVGSYPTTTTGNQISPRTNGNRVSRGNGLGGRKRALVCGVSYKGQKYKLRGTLSDALCMRDFLVDKWGFSRDYIRMLTEEDGGSRSNTPTKKNMEAGLKWLVEGCKAGDSLVFYFSGHGMNQREFLYRDEIDGMDETLCPVDFSTQGVIRDNELNSILVRPLPNGVTLHAIVDACHSGTILDLPRVFNVKRNEWADNSPPSGANKGSSGGRVISFSACRDDQMAADTSAFTKNGMNGALTMSFIQALNKYNQNLTYHQLLLIMQESIIKSRGSRFRIFLDKFLRRYFFQDPVLSSSEEFDVHKTYFSF